MPSHAKILFIGLLISEICYAQSSVLSTGMWYKLAISQEGVYCITRSDLISLGINVSSIDPRNLSVYGNKAGMLPYDMALSPANDLKEIAIEIKGESDGVFDAGDTIFFYGESQNVRYFDNQTNTFRHKTNIYSDSTFYFLTIGTAPGKRIQTKNNLVTFTYVSNGYNEFIWHEKDSVNFLHSGQQWFGEELSTPGNNTFGVYNDITHIVPGDSLKIRYSYVARKLNSATCNMLVSFGSPVNSQSISAVGNSPQDSYALYYQGTDNIANPNVNAPLSFTLQCPDTVHAYIDYFELNFLSKLELYKPQQIISDLNGSIGRITKYQIANANPSVKIWDITDPLNVTAQQFQAAFPTIEFNAANDSQIAFIAFDGTAYYTPTLIGQVANQNLHSIGARDNLIITIPEFLNEANTLGAFRQSHDGLQTEVVTTTQIYNEYSTGSQDPVGIRNFIKQVFDSSVITGDSLKYVLLFGSGSYDFRGRLGYHSSFVPTFQSAGSLNRTLTFNADQFYAYMDGSSMSAPGSNIMLAVGRIPVRTVSEASVVNRIIDYSSSGSYGHWRTKIFAVADDQDHNTHFKQMDTLCNRLEDAHCEFDIDKIYIDSYPQDTTGGIHTYPGARYDIEKGFQNGGLVMHYIGHGGVNGWAEENILDSLLLQSVNNINRAPLIVCGSTSFNQYDDPEINSCARILTTSLNSSGIASISSTRLAFSSSNFNLDSRILFHLYNKVNGEYLRLGDVWKRAKQDYYTDPYTYSNCLLGDPSMRLNFPENDIVITAVNGNPVTAIPDTILPGQALQLNGEIHDPSGSLLTSFNGTVDLMIFDQKTFHQTLANDSIGPDISTVQPFYEWDDTINFVPVTAPVINGVFSINYVFPYNLDSAIGTGRISLYANDGTTDASGCFENFILKNLTSGIDEVPGISVILYPNPSDDKITFEFKGEFPAGLNFNLFDGIGQLIRNEKIKSRIFTVSKAEMSSGVYFYRIVNRDRELMGSGRVVFE